MIDLDPGEVPREIVLSILRYHKVEVFCDDPDPEMLTFIKGDKMESRRVPPILGRKQLQYFKRAYSIPMHHFYHPDAVLGRTEPLQ